jgi:hypothetical protein
MTAAGPRHEQCQDEHLQALSGRMRLFDSWSHISAFRLHQNKNTKERLKWQYCSNLTGQTKSTFRDVTANVEAMLAKDIKKRCAIR